MSPSSVSFCGRRATISVAILAASAAREGARTRLTFQQGADYYRARVKDVDARTRGAITSEELRRRVEVTEY